MSGPTPRASLTTEPSSGPTEHHVPPVSVYLKVYAALVALTGATIALSFVGVRQFGVFCAVAIAATQGTLIVGWLAQRRRDPQNRLHSLVLASTLVGVAVLFALVFADVATRD